MVDPSITAALTSPEAGREPFHPTPLSMRYRRQGHHNDGNIDGKNPAPREMPSYDFLDGQIQSL